LERFLVDIALQLKRGEAIAAAKYIKKIDFEVVNFGQYGDIGNTLSYFLTTASEIYHQTNEKITHLVIVPQFREQ
jgi:cysteine synthase